MPPGPAAIPASSRPATTTATMRRWRSSSWSTASPRPRARIPARCAATKRKKRRPNLRGLCRNAVPIVCFASRLSASTRKDRQMARLPPITAKNQVPAKDHAVFDSIVASRGAVQGPFTMFLHAPEVSERVAHLGAYVRFEGSLDMRVRVLAAMTAAREFEAVYVWGAQTGGARRQGVPETTIAAIRDNHSRGIPPEDAQIVDFTRALLRKHRVDDAAFKAMQA